MLSHDPAQQNVGRRQWENRTRDRLTALIETAADISEAYQLRDEMLHGIPRIAETLMSDPGAFRDYERLDDRSTVVVAEAIDALTNLVDELQLPRPGDIEPIEKRERRAIDSAFRARAAYNKLQNRVTKIYDDVTQEKAPDARALRQNLALLVGSGTANARQRQWVHDRICTLLEEFDSIGSGGETDTAAREQVVIKGRPVWDYWVHATASFSPDSVRTTTKSESDDEHSSSAEVSQEVFADAGDDFRNSAKDIALGELSKQAQSAIKDPIRIAEAGGRLSEIRRGLDHWDTYLRSRTVHFSDTPEKLVPISQGRFALDQLLFAFDHASRTMNEYWGPARPGDKEAYFPSAAGELISMRQSNPFFSELTASINDRSLIDWLDQAKDDQKFGGTLLPQPGEDARNGVLQRFVAGKESEFTLDRPETVPTGLASVWSESESLLVPLGANVESKIPLVLRVPKTVSSSNPFAPSLFFRGLRRQGTLRINPEGEAVKTVFRLPRYDAPEVYVVRANKEPERVLLIVDCSFSMGGDEGPDDLGVARKAINEFLARLPDNNVEVGLILFGHRYGFDMEKIGKDYFLKFAGRNKNGKPLGRLVKWVNGQEVDSGQLIDPTKRTDSDPVFDVNPNFDVEYSHTIQPLTNARRAEIAKKLFEAGPIGMTPTWQALIQAYKSELKTRKGHIILLTDGKPRLGKFKGTEIKDYSTDAIQLIRSNDGVRLTVVQFINRRPELVKRLKGLATFDVATNGEGLLRVLSNATQQPKVVWQRNRDDVSKTGRFDKLLEIDQWPPRGVEVADGQPEGTLPAGLMLQSTGTPSTMLSGTPTAPVSGTRPCSTTSVSGQT